MATVKKGSGSAARRRIRSAVKEAAATMRETNGAAQQGAHDVGTRADITTNIEIIRARAYQLFLARGASHGDDLADWFNAERELRAARNF